MRVSFMAKSYEQSTDANTAPEFSSASLIRLNEGTVVNTVSLFVISAIIFLQLIIIRAIGILKHINYYCCFSAFGLLNIKNFERGCLK